MLLGRNRMRFGGFPGRTCVNLQPSAGNPLERDRTYLVANINETEEAAMRIRTGFMGKSKAEVEKLERDAAELLVECGRLRRENARLRRMVEEVREAVTRYGR